MKKMTEMNRLQQEVHRLQAKEIQFNDMLQPYQEQIVELVDTVKQNVKEFTTRKSEVDDTEDSIISQAMLEAAQYCVKAMVKEVAGLRERFTRTSQEAKKKLQKDKPDVSDSRTSHK